jgi:hypothetical protein
MCRDKTTPANDNTIVNFGLRSNRMADELDRLIQLAGRCSGPAWDQLKQLRDHPFFEQIVEALAVLEGTILEYDVDRAIAKLTTSQSGTDANRSQ